MTAFAQRRIPCGPIADIAQRRGVVKAGELRLAAQAASMLDAARGEARQLLAAAERKAGALVAAAREEAQRLVDDTRGEAERERERLLEQAESEIWRRAVDHGNALEEHYRGFTSALEEQVLDIVRKTLTALALEMPPQARLRACTRLILDDAGRPAEARLVVSEQDHDSIEALAADLPWPVEFDAAAAPGSCVLLSARGEWRCSFEGNLKRLLRVFERPAEESMPGEITEPGEGHVAS